MTTDIEETNDKPDMKLRSGIVWYAGQWRHFNKWEDVTKGKYKNFIKIFTAGKPFHVRKVHIKRFPEMIEVVPPRLDDEKPWIISIRGSK